MRSHSYAANQATQTTKLYSPSLPLLSFSAGADCHDVEDQHWINGYPTPIANPMSVYPRYQAQRKSWGINALGSVVVEVESEDGTIGVGEAHNIIQFEFHLKT